MKHKKRNIILSIIVIVIAVLVWHGYQSSQAPKKVTTINISREDLNIVVSASGKVESAVSVDLSFTGAGRISALSVAEGDRVKKGQVLAYLDGTTLQQQENKAWADYKFQLEKIREFEEKNKDKPKDINYQIAKSQLEATRDSYAALVGQTLSGYRDKTLVSPIDGIIAKINSQVGETPTSLPVMTVIDDTQVEFISEVDEQDIGTITQGLTTTVILDAYAGKKFTGTVTKIETVAKTGSTGNTFYPVHISLPRDQATLLIGMNGDADIETATKQNVTVVPLDVINDEEDKLFVYVLEGNQAKKVYIQIGLQNDTDAEVISGLKEGDEVITGDIQNIEDGQLVQKEIVKK